MSLIVRLTLDAPIVQGGFTSLNKQIIEQQKAFEAEYIKLYAKDPAAAQKLLDNFTYMTVNEVLDETAKLTNQILTDMTVQVNLTYHFEGA